MRRRNTGPPDPTSQRAAQAQDLFFFRIKKHQLDPPMSVTRHRKAGVVFGTGRKSWMMDGGCKRSGVYPPSIIQCIAPRHDRMGDRLSVCWMVDGLVRFHLTSGSGQHISCSLDAAPLRRHCDRRRSPMHSTPRGPPSAGLRGRPPRGPPGRRRAPRLSARGELVI